MRCQKVQRNVGVRHQVNKRQGIVRLRVKLEGFSRSPSNSAARHNKAVTTLERDNKGVKEYDDLLGVMCNHTSMRTSHKSAQPQRIVPFHVRKQLEKQLRRYMELV